MYLAQTRSSMHRSLSVITTILSSTRTKQVWQRSKRQCFQVGNYHNNIFDLQNAFYLAVLSPHLPCFISFGTSTRGAGQRSSAGSKDKAVEAQSLLVHPETQGQTWLRAVSWESMIDRLWDQVATGHAGWASMENTKTLRWDFSSWRPRMAACIFSQASQIPAWAVPQVDTE